MWVTPARGSWDRFLEDAHLSWGCGKTGEGVGGLSAPQNEEQLYEGTESGRSIIGHGLVWCDKHQECVGGQSESQAGV